MKANEFVKRHGWESLLIARKLPQFNRYKYVIFYADEIDFSNEFHAGRKSYMFEVAEVKRLVESHELVEKHGGIDSLNDLFCVYGMRSVRLMAVGSLTYARAMQAIADVESCQ